MINSEITYTNVPAFLSKLWSLVGDPNTDDLISWDCSGTSFHIFDPNKFAKEILPLYFKHNNITSFIRQLNMYGFRKVSANEFIKSEKDDLVFAHQYFRRDSEHLLELIKRRAPIGKPEQNANLSKKDWNKIMGEMTGVKDKLDTMTDKLDTLKSENSILWKELVNLRQKHTRQQQVVTKLIQFFISMVNNERNATTLKRKIPLMLEPLNTDNPPSYPNKVIIVDDNGEQYPSYKEIYKLPVKSEPIDIFMNTDSNILNNNNNNHQIIELDDNLEPLALVDPLIPSNKSPELENLFFINNEHTNHNNADPNNLSYYPNIKTPGNTIDFNLDVDSMPQTILDNQNNQQEYPSTLNTPNIILSEDKNNSKALISKCEPSYMLSDKEKEEVYQQMYTLDSSLDNLRDLFNSGQYNLDNASLMGLLNLLDQVVTSKDTQDELSAHLNKSKFDLTSNNVGKELIQYTPFEDILNSYDMKYNNDDSPLNPSNETIEQVTEDQENYDLLFMENDGHLINDDWTNLDINSLD